MKKIAFVMLFSIALFSQIYAELTREYLASVSKYLGEPCDIKIVNARIELLDIRTTCLEYQIMVLKEKQNDSMVKERAKSCVKDVALARAKLEGFILLSSFVSSYSEYIKMEIPITKLQIAFYETGNFIRSQFKVEDLTNEKITEKFKNELER